jgi:hypothetical protein
MKIKIDINLEKEFIENKYMFEAIRDMVVIKLCEEIGSDVRFLEFVAKAKKRYTEEILKEIVSRNIKTDRT